MPFANTPSRKSLTSTLAPEVKDSWLASWRTAAGSPEGPGPRVCTFAGGARRGVRQRSCRLCLDKCPPVGKAVAALPQSRARTFGPHAPAPKAQIASIRGCARSNSSPLPPWGRGWTAPAFSSAGAGRVRGSPPSGENAETRGRGCNPGEGNEKHLPAMRGERKPAEPATPFCFLADAR